MPAAIRTPGKDQAQTLVHGPKTLMAEFKLEQGRACRNTNTLMNRPAILCPDGWTDDRRRDAPGSARRQLVHSGDIEHNAVAHERSVAVEVFSPVREDYLP